MGHRNFGVHQPHCRRSLLQWLSVGAGAPHLAAARAAGEQDTRAAAAPRQLAGRLGRRQQARAARRIADQRRQKQLLRRRPWGKAGCSQISFRTCENNAACLQQRNIIIWSVDCLQLILECCKL